MTRVHEVAAYWIVACFVTYFVVWGAADSLSQALTGNYLFRRFPDFSKYRELQTLTRHEFPIDEPTRRVIIVGDIHGMIGPLQDLLHKVDYDSSRDVLIHVGDIIATGSLNGSLAVLQFLSEHNVTGVRGNHDQKVVEWREWLNWIISHPGGQDWLSHLERKWREVSEKNLDVNLRAWIEQERQENADDRKWWKLLPNGWVPLRDHYLIAKGMSDKESQYLLSLPLRLYVPHVHAFVVHAGMLPADPRYPLDDEKRQPMARIPILPGHRHGDVDQLRHLQETSLLSRVPQNTDPWVVLNVRNILNGKPTRKNRGGTFWASVWKEQMNSCVGFDEQGSDLQRDAEEREVSFLSDEDLSHLKLPCHPVSIIYGHTAAKGLAIKRWTFGLDSGCVYGRSLSALVIGDFDTLLDDAEFHKDDHHDASDEGDNLSRKKSPRPLSRFNFSDNLEATIVNVKC